MIVDTNIAVHWFMATEFSSAAARFRDRADLAAPSFILVEAANTLYKYARRGTIDPRHCSRSVELLEYQLRDIVPNEQLLPEAIRLALANQHPVYDCLYLALALERREPLVTADRRLAAIAGTVGIEAELIEPI
jgi:predicted nucleic acid-binding protein